MSMVVRLDPDQLPESPLEQPLLVLAARGLLVPKEHAPRDYLTDTPPQGDAGHVVPATAYYLRRIADGDLVEVEGKANTPPATKKG